MVGLIPEIYAAGVGVAFFSLQAWLGGALLAGLVIGSAVVLALNISLFLAIYYCTVEAKADDSS